MVLGLDNCLVVQTEFVAHLVRVHLHLVQVNNVLLQEHHLAVNLDALVIKLRNSLLRLLDLQLASLNVKDSLLLLPHQHFLPITLLSRKLLLLHIRLCDWVVIIIFKPRVHLCLQFVDMVRNIDNQNALSLLELSEKKALLFGL